MSIEQVIVSAIRNKIPLEVNYKNHSRLVCPCRIGWKTNKKGETGKNVFVYQFGGHSEKGLKPDGSMENFRCWHLDDIHSAVPIGGQWHFGKGWPKERSNCIDEILEEVGI